jgi:hypothetical protein
MRESNSLQAVSQLVALAGGSSERASAGASRVPVRAGNATAESRDASPKARGASPKARDATAELQNVPKCSADAPADLQKSVENVNYASKCDVMKLDHSTRLDLNCRGLIPDEWAKRDAPLELELAEEGNPELPAIDQLKDRQRMAVRLLVEQVSGAEVAELLDVCRQTVSRWKRSPLFRRALREEVDRRAGDVVATSRSLIRRAMVVIEESLNGDRPDARQTALAILRSRRLWQTAGASAEER